MSIIRCKNLNCGVVFGPVVGPNAIISVGKQHYLFAGLLARQCQACQAITGTVPPIPQGEEPQPVLCPTCGKKCGEIYSTHAVVSAGGRTIWAKRIVHVQCTRCVSDWEPTPIIPRGINSVPTAGAKGVV